jgi:sugar-specific transcriptional regulator TrmB
MTIKEYKKEISDAIKDGLDRRFPNSSIEHAKILVKEIINNSDKEVFSLSSSFNQDFYLSLEKEIRNFLNRPNTKFNLIVANNENGIISKFKKEYPKQFIVRLIEKDEMPVDKNSQEHVNYIVNDKNAYRYEYSDKNIDIGIVEAIANFNNPEESKVLLDNFNKLLSK